MPRNAAVTFENLLLPPAEFSDPAAPEYRLCLVLQGEAELSWQQDDRWRSARLRPGMFAPITRPQTTAQLRLSAHQRHLMVTLDDATVRSVASGCGQTAVALDALSERPFRNPFLARLCAEAYAEAQREDALGRHFQTTVAPILIGSLLRSSGSAPKRDTAGGRALAPATLARLRESCLAQLDTPITVARLADWSGLPVGEFCRQLRQRTGTTPHRFVLDLRLARAAELLGQVAPPIADVASRCGFFDQAHLTQAFSRRYGTSPARYRRERLGHAAALT